MQEGLNELLTMLSENAGLHRIVEKVSEMAGYPATIIDNSFSFLAISEGYPELHSSANIPEDVSLGHLPPAIQYMMRNTYSEVFYPGKKRTEPAYFDIELPNGHIVRNYLTLIYLKNVSVGSFSVFTAGEDLPASKLWIFPKIAALLSLEMQKSDFYSLNKATYYQHILTRLLDDADSPDDEIFRSHLATFGYSLKKYKRIVVVETGDEYRNISHIHLFADRFNSEIPNSLYFVHDGLVIFLSTFDSEEAPLGELARAWQKSILGSNLRIGVSSIFVMLSRFADGLKQAKNAIVTGRRFSPSENIFLFDAYRFADLIRHMPKDRDLNFYSFPPLIRVFRHDQENGSQLALTLYRYLSNPDHPAEVCRELFIHKNTLYYRLGKIRDIMQADFDNMESIAQIYFTFTLLQSRGEFTPPRDETVGNPERR
ncbi:MAG: helix-turn-helix domain-containing protein [Clostridiales Family XIII bacterium]|nr:helix-turn-helix domain-containing protein [Clostridiales Family XIII bacterium]